MFLVRDSFPSRLSFCRTVRSAMVSLRNILALLSALAVSQTWAKLPDGRPHANSPKPPTVPHISAPGVPLTNVYTGESLPPLDTIYHFDQLIDHTDPSLGTFKQRYWHTWQWYKQGNLV